MGSLLLAAKLVAALSTALLASSDAAQPPARRAQSSCDRPDELGEVGCKPVVIFCDDVTIIPERCLYGCDMLLHVTFPDSVTEIRDWAFGININLDTIVWGSSIHTIGEEAFTLNGGMSTIVIPDSVTTIKNGAFSFTHATSIVLPAGVTVKYQAFAATNVVDLTIPEGVVLEDEAFAENRLMQTLHIGPGVYLHDQVFENAWELRRLTIDDGLLVVGNNAFKGSCKISKFRLGSFSDTARFLPDCNVIEVAELYTDATVDLVLGHCNNLENLTIDRTTRIEAEAFMGCEKLEHLQIGDAVTNIGWMAFANCSRLQSLELPPSVHTIAVQAFMYCTALKTVTLGSSTQYIGAEVFANCPSLTDVTVPGVLPTPMSAVFDCTTLAKVKFLAGFSTIGDDFLAGCSSVVSVDFSSGIMSIGQRAFSGCTSLTQIMDLDGSVAEIGDAAFEGCVSLANIDFGGSVTSVSSSAFAGCSALASVDFGQSLVDIGPSAFSGCSSLEAAIMPDTVISIGSEAFLNCVELNDLQLSNAKTIGSSAFQGCSALTQVWILHAPDYIGSDVFAGCDKLTSAIMASSNTRIPDGMFSSCASLVDVQLPSSLTSIGACAFCGCAKLKAVDIPDGVASIGASAFENCTVLMSLTISSSVVDLGERAFAGCSFLPYVFVPESVSNLGDGCFSRCASLTSVTIPESVLAKGFANTFHHCDLLGTVTIFGTPRIIPSGAFKGATSVIKVDIPRTVFDIGSSAFEGCTSLDEIILPNGVYSISSWSFAGCISLGRLVIGLKVSSIGASAFLNCSALTRIELPPTLSSIGDHAFAGCTSLTRVSVPDAVVSFGRGVFAGCSMLDSIQVPDAVVSQDEAMESAWGGCGGVVSLTMSDKVASIGEDAFASCTALRYVQVNDFVLAASFGSIFTSGDGCANVQSVSIADSVSSIAPRAFAGCASLVTMSMPSSVKTIGEAAFQECTGLVSVDIPDSVTRIDALAFDGCERLELLNIPETVAHIGPDAFRGCTQLSSVTLPEGVITTVGFKDCALLQSYEGRRYYTSAESGCVQCPDLSITVLEVFLIIVLGGIVALGLVSAGWVASSNDGERFMFTAASAIQHAVLLGAQALQVITQDVPWPPRLQQALKALDFVAVRLDRVQPECQNFPVSSLTRTILVLYCGPALLALCYFVLAMLMGKRRILRLMGTALLANMYWIMIALLQWSWQFLGCGYPAVVFGDQASPVLLVGDEREVRCSVDDGDWVTLAVVSLPALLALQILMPAWMILNARRPHMQFATAPYREEWKRSWLAVDIGYKTWLVLGRLAFLSKVDEPWVRGRLLVRSLMLLLGILGYYSAMIFFGPYRLEVLKAADGFLFLSILASGVTLMCFTAAATWWVGADRSTPFSTGYDGWEEPQDGSYVDSTASPVVVLELFLILTLALWLFLSAYTLAVYSPLARFVWCWRPEKRIRFVDDADVHDAFASTGSMHHRRDLGTFTTGAKNAIISTPGAVARSFQVRLNRRQGRDTDRQRVGVLLDSENGAPPAITVTRSYLVRWADTNTDELVNGSELAFVGTPEDGSAASTRRTSRYEFWNTAINRVKVLREYSFACVWVPNIAGCTQKSATFGEWLEGQERREGEDSSPRHRSSLAQFGFTPDMITDENWEKYQNSTAWVHRSLADGYAAFQPIPECDNCAWFDFWAINVMRCEQDGQALRFAYLNLPLKEDQPVFQYRRNSVNQNRASTLSNGSFYYVGIAQRVELEWVQEMMEFEVSPISFEAEIVGASSSEMRLLGTVIVATTSFHNRRNPEAAELYGKLDKILSKRIVARSRRRKNRLIFTVAMVFPLVLSILRSYGAVLEKDVGLRAVTQGMAIALAFGSGLMLLAKGSFFEKLASVFSEEDKMEDDEFAEELARRFEVYPRQDSRAGGSRRRSSDVTVQSEEGELPGSLLQNPYSQEAVSAEIVGKESASEPRKGEEHEKARLSASEL